MQETQKTNTQHAVPQNIMDVEFKIIGDLTMRQFIYLIIFFAGAYICYLSIPRPFAWFFIVVLVLTGIGLAFFPVEERGLDQWIINFFKSVYSPNQRIWRKEPSPPTVFVYQSIEMLNRELVTLAPTSSRRKLEEYLRSRDTETVVDKLDIPEMEYIEKVRAAFPRVARTIRRVAKPGVYGPVPAPPIGEVVKEGRPKPKIVAGPAVKEDGAEPKEVKRPEEQKLEEEEKPEIIELEIPQTPAGEVFLAPITPDRHSGRRFINLTPGQGQLILPIRGERVIKTSEELVIEQDINKKAEQLKKLMEQLKNDRATERIAAGGSREGTKRETPSKPVVRSNARIIKEERGEDASKSALYREIGRLKQELKTLGGRGEETGSGEKMMRELSRVKALSGAEDQSVKIAAKPSPHPSVSITTGKVRKESKLPRVSMGSRTNLISGVVKDGAGKLVDGVVLVVKNKSGAPVRALKTDPLGKFSVSTALPNGEYTITVDSTKKTTLSFDIISVNLTGDVTPPINVIGY